ncbi:MAG: hypothetical protein P4L84_11410 [Isosphaeraceae bacterium]|nr:hypothetical protein [Isosphaeraceae bacterium]
MAANTKTVLPALFATAILLSAAARGQGPAGGKDNDLDQFLKKLDDADKPQKAGQPEKGDAKKGDVSDKDKDLDQFLEKLGQTKETPSPEEKRPGMSQSGGEPQPGESGGGKKKGDELKGSDKQTDEHLEELTGRIKKKKGQNQGEGSGPLSEIIKEMRDVEQRLGKPDTGDETRKKQEQIVKRLDQVIQQLRQSGSSSSGKKKMVMVRQAGQKPGQLPLGEQPGTTGGNAPHTKPQKPDPKRSLFGSKDEWGHLPDQLRQEMDNVFKEEALPSREDLIKRYYLSLTKKALAREE